METWTRFLPAAVIATWGIIVIVILGPELPLVWAIGIMLMCGWGAWLCFILAR